MSHLSEGDIERFLTGRAVPWERQGVVRHLLAGCGICSRKLLERAPDRLLDEAQESRRGRASRDPLRDRTVAAALEQDSRWRVDQRKLGRSLELLGTRGEGYDALTFRQVQALHGRPLVEALLQRSWESRFGDPEAMRWLAYNALKAAESLRPEKHGPALILDLQARAWAGLANAYKVNDEYGEADAAFARARDLLRRGSGDLSILAELAWLEASLRSFQRRLAEARELLDRVYRLSLKLGDRRFSGQILFSQGLLSNYDDTPRQGISLFRQGLALLDPDRDSELLAVGQHGLISLLVGSHLHQEAGRLLLKSDLRRRFGDEPRLRWSEGKLLLGLGQSAKAQSALMQARERFLAQGRPISAAHVGVDLLPILSREGKHTQLRKLARELYGLFRDQRLHSEAAKARSFLQ